MSVAQQIETLSLGYLTLPQFDSIAILDAAAAASFRRVGLRVAGRLPSVEGVWPTVEPAYRRQIAEHAEALGVRISNVAAYYTGPDTTVESFRPVFETAATFGAIWVCTSGYDPDELRLADTLAALADSARDYGIAMALEFVPYSELRTLDTALRVVNSVGAANLGILLDAMHFIRSGGSVAELAAVPASRLAFAQVCDGPLQRSPGVELAVEARTGRLLPGEGMFPLRDMLAVLPPTIQLEVETPTMRLAGLPPAEQAIATGRATRAWLETQI